MSLKAHMNLNFEVGQKIIDYMGSTELIAYLFRISQTEEKLRKDEVDNAKTATSIRYSVGKEVCSAIEKIGALCPRISRHRRKAYKKSKRNRWLG